MLVCNYYSLRKAMRRVSQLYDHMLAPLGLKTTQYMLLGEISRHEPIAMLPLAKIMVMDRATLGHNIRPLEAGGYITLSVGKDRRSREISLTKAGRKAVDEGEALWRNAQAIFEKEIGSEEAASLRIALNRVAGSEFLDNPK